MGQIPPRDSSTKQDKGDGVLAALCVLLTAACGYDYRKRRIPNYLIAAAAFLGAGWRFLSEGGGGIFSFGAEAALIMCLLYPFFRIGAVGAGDVKLLGVTAGFLPFEKILWFLFFSMIFSMVRFMKQKDAKERLEYLLAYLAGVAVSGRWRLYMEDAEERRRTGICLSGPVFLSLLLYLGGVY